MKILIAGGAGFIGSTIASAFRDSGHRLIVLDDFSTGLSEFVNGSETFVGDVGDAKIIDEIFRMHPDIDVAIHCAAKIVVPDSIADPIGYYKSNVSKSCEFASNLIRNDCNRLIFSSSASIYASDGPVEISEDSPILPASPYARTKAVCEMMFSDISAASNLRVLSLRYFNPIGADPELRSGLQTRMPTHALENLIRAYQSETDFQISGMGFETRDGSGIRDYVHVWDVAQAHVKAAEKYDTIFGDQVNFDFLNIGSGKGTTVLELISEFEAVVGKKIRVSIGDRRPGDVRGVYSKYSKAHHVLEWTPTLGLHKGIVDSLAWSKRRIELLGY